MQSDRLRYHPLQAENLDAFHRLVQDEHVRRYMMDGNLFPREWSEQRQGIREHRDSTRQELCWHHPALWGLLPEKTDPIPVVPEWPEFLQGCLIYRQSLDEQAPDAPRTKGP